MERLQALSRGGAQRDCVGFYLEFRAAHPRAPTITAITPRQ